MRQAGMIQRTVQRVMRGLQAVSTLYPGSWWGPIRESYTGAWQQNVTIDPQTSLLAFSAVFACVTGIASDIAKLRIKLMENEDGIWEEIDESSPWLPVLRRPNSYQNRIKFIEQWIVSKLLWGNAYILKERRDARGIVTAMYVLNPQRVITLVADDGGIYYQLLRDPLSRVTQDNALLGNNDNPIVPASEIIQDSMVGLWHPLIGVSPIYACGVSATMGNKIQNNSTALFGNLSRPGGILTATGHIKQETADRLKVQWEKDYGGANLGRIMVAGDGLKFEAFAMPATDAQLIEQLRWTVEDVARAFHYPVFKLGGPLPAYASTPDALTTMYYTDCLQALIEALELCLDEGLELPAGKGTELDLDNLMRMDTAALFDSNNKAVGGGWMAPDEARFRANLPAVPGGAYPYLQQQNYSLEALAKRDANDPFAKPAASSPPALPPAEEPQAAMLDAFNEAEFLDALEKELCRG